ncbi:glycogen phosphorylase [Rhodobacteraceae bacterium WD3A24]|nr:glycogen phosphorylase [Rhodobacteraceae bacterium WD3A24]
MTTSELRAAILWHLKYSQGKLPAEATAHHMRAALTLAVRDRIVEPWLASARATRAAGAKRVYYLSMEFLIGRLLEDAMVNLGLMEAAREAVTALDFDFIQVMCDEPDAALGNGGLGRLAACFLDSMSTLGCPAHGYGIRYEHGLFRQSFREGAQVESPEDWLRDPNHWEFERAEASFTIGFGGTVGGEGRRTTWLPDEAVTARAYDTPIVGWQGRWANTLRLWAAQPVEPLDLDRFNRGEFSAAAAPEAAARAISRVLYPDDSTEAGKTLRLRQEYFFTAASLRDILRRFLIEYDDLAKLPAKAAIQLNDTHPAIAGPELVRLLHDVHGMDFEAAIDAARGTLAYTNHTLLPEALESWDEGLMTRLLPRHMQIIEAIDSRHACAHPGRRAGARADGQVRMGELAFIMAHRVNGVSALHTDLVKSTVFSDLHRLHPDRIVNETNGVTPRRWLLGANPRLSSLITDTVGPGWEDDLERLEGLAAHLSDVGFLDRFAQIKRANKSDLSNWIARELGERVDPDAMFDIQIKRIHEYKRQHLNILETIALWAEMRERPEAGWVPRVKIFGGKAAPGYAMAKRIIRLINDVARAINADPRTRDLLRVVFPPNYNVTMAERLIPAADLSEQISTAGKEASGTGNMKFALNGAPTIGTLDGANVEIRERVGAENFFLFGMTADEVVARRETPDHAAQAIAASPALAGALDRVARGEFSDGDTDRYAPLVADLRGHDYFCVCDDFDAYRAAQREAAAAYADAARWTAMAAANTAHSGWFSSDRAIRGYMADIWDAAPLI